MCAHPALGACRAGTSYVMMRSLPRLQASTCSRFPNSSAQRTNTKLKNILFPTTLARLLKIQPVQSASEVVATRCFCLVGTLPTLERLTAINSDACTNRAGCELAHSWPQASGPSAISGNGWLPVILTCGVESERLGKHVPP